MHNFCYKIYIYLCANLHLRCRIAFYTHPASKPTSKPTILRTRPDHLRGPSGPRSTPAQPRYPDPAAPNHNPSPVVPLQSTVHPTTYQDSPAAATGGRRCSLTRTHSCALERQRWDPQEPSQRPGARRPQQRELGWIGSGGCFPRA